jgi:hypothetical protein
MPVLTPTAIRNAVDGVCYLALTSAAGLICRMVTCNLPVGIELASSRSHPDRIAPSWLPARLDKPPSGTLNPDNG